MAIAGTCLRRLVTFTQLKKKLAVTSLGHAARSDTVEHVLRSGRGGWLQVARGSVSLKGEILYEGDGVALPTSGPLRIAGLDNAEALLFDMAV